MIKNNINVLFICPYPTGQAPSQRFRFEQYLSLIGTNAFTYDIHSFLSNSTWQVLYRSNNSIHKILGILKGFIKRFLLLPFIIRYDLVFIHREATPIGPPWFEWIVAKVFKKKIIYDFDDAIWMSDEFSENKMVKVLKWRQKVEQIIKWSWKISCGNQFLKNYAIQFNLNSFLNPTTIDALNLHKRPRNLNCIKKDMIAIGWTGSHSTLKYLEIVYPILFNLLKKYNNVEFIVIANTKPTIQLERVQFIKWNLLTEIEDLAKIDIGIMPLPNDEWSKGKCGFKLLQYMALGIPCIGSRVGANIEIVNDGINGFLCSTEEEWILAIEKLILNENLRSFIAGNGRRTILDKYSVQSNEGNFLSLFNL